jgi:hypothetical protein
MMLKNLILLQICWIFSLFISTILSSVISEVCHRLSISFQPGTYNKWHWILWNFCKKILLYHYRCRFWNYGIYIELLCKTTTSLNRQVSTIETFPSYWKILFIYIRNKQWVRKMILTSEMRIDWRNPGSIVEKTRGPSLGYFWNTRSITLSTNMTPSVRKSDTKDEKDFFITSAYL